MTWGQLVESFGPMATVAERKGRTGGVTRLVIRSKSRCLYRRNIRYTGPLPKGHPDRPKRESVVAAFLASPVPPGVLRSLTEQAGKK